MVIVNFSHPITASQRGRIELMTSQIVERVIDVKTQFDGSSGFAAQVSTLVDAAHLSAEEWQRLPVLVNLPSFSIIAALVLAEIHGRAGVFPAVIRIRPTDGSAPREFEVAEILDMQGIRDAARSRR